MLMRPPYGDHAASPVSSYRMNRKLGAPSGAFFGVYGVQSGLELRTSRLITPLKPGVAGRAGACCADTGCCEHPATLSVNPIASPTSATNLQTLIDASS